MIQIRRLLGVGLFFLGIGLWGILFCSAFLLLVPTIVTVFVAGYLTRTNEWPAFKSWWVWEWLRKHYFNFQLQGNAETIAFMQKPPNHIKIIYAIYPHGHLAVTHVFFWALNPVFKQAKAAVHSAVFWLPVLGTIAGWIGATSVTESDMIQALDTHKHIFMCPGGIKDIENTGTTIKKRTGFLRVASEQNAMVIPVWCPDERFYYTQWLPLGRTFSEYLFFPIPMFIFGTWWSLFMFPKPPASGVSRVCVGKIIYPNTVNCEALFWEQIETLQKGAEHHE